MSVSVTEAAATPVPPPAPEAAVTRYEFIDALRGFAFLGVLVTHVVPRVGGLPDFAYRVAVAGAEGVQLFFIISALTLFLSFDSRRGTQARPLAAFLVRRFFRIAPLFYLAAIFYPWFASRWSGAEVPGASAFLATFGFVHVWHPDTVNRVVPGGWSIGVEMEFYLLVPYLYAKVRRVETAVAATLVSLVAGGVLSVAVRAALPRLLGTERDAAGLFVWWWLPNCRCSFLVSCSISSSAVASARLTRSRLTGRGVDFYSPARPTYLLLLSPATFDFLATKSCTASHSC